MKFIFFLLLFFYPLFSITLFAQARLEALETEYNFGEIKEEGGSVTHTFIIKNVGNKDLVVTEVRPSCGCTTPFWTKDPITPDKKGKIQVAYNPLNRPGSFRKSLTITSNADNGKQFLFIVGNVKPKPKSSVVEFPIAKGNIYFKKNYLNIGEIKNKGKITKKFDFLNNGEKAITFDANQTFPKHINFSFDSLTVQPKSKGIIKIIYDAKEKAELGNVNDIISIKTDDDIQPIKKISVFASISLYFPKMDVNEMKKAPRIEFEKLLHNFSKSTTGELLEYNFSFVNRGKNDLKIIDIKRSCSCLTVSPSIKTISEKQKGEIKVTFNTKNRLGDQVKTIDIFTNDPKNSEVRLTIRASLQKQEHN